MTDFMISLLYVSATHHLTGFFFFSSVQHWIRLELFPDVLVHRLKMIVDPADSSYMPSLVVVSGEFSFINSETHLW